MPPLSEQQRAKLRRETRGAALALLEDLQYLREVTERIETSRGELRRLSALLRRLVVEGDIAHVATSRIGRIKFLAPDNSLFYKVARRARCLFFASGGAKVFGIDIAAHAFWNFGPAEKDHVAHAERVAAPLKNHNSMVRIELPLQNFMSQRVLCYNDNWFSRREAIKYVANVASGVHSKRPTKDEEKLIERVRDACTYSIKNGQLEAHILPELGRNSAPLKITPGPRGPSLDFSADALDPVLVEMLATAQLLIASPDACTLEEIIRHEADQAG